MIYVEFYFEECFLYMKKVKGIILYVCSWLLLMLFKVNQVYAASDLGCNGIFGDPSDPNSVANLIKDVLNLFRILAPILVIVLGSLDLFMAMASSSEDKMKKAQSTMVRRVILGVCLFFVPAIINFILDAASKSLGYDACMFNW